MGCCRTDAEYRSANFERRPCLNKRLRTVIGQSMKAMKSGAVAVTLGVFLGLAVAAGPAQAQSPFAGLTGSWSGNGKITANNGASERIRCRGTYRASKSGRTLALRLRCAGDSYKFEIASDINYDGGNISGSWSETTRQVHGSISGRATPTKSRRRLRRWASTPRSRFRRAATARASSSALRAARFPKSRCRWRAPAAERQPFAFCSV